MFFSFPFWCQMLVNVKSVIKQNFVLQVKNNFNYLLSFSWSLCFISCFSQKINLFWIAKLVRDCKGRIVALGLFCTDLTAISSYRQDLGLIFPQYCPCVWLWRYFTQIEWHLHLWDASMQSRQIYMYYCRTHKKWTPENFWNIIT